MSEARYAIWGLAWILNFAVMRAAFPQVAATLRGWARAAPDRAKDSMPFEAMMLLAHILMSSTDKRLGEHRRAAARILPRQWDLYMRPSEALQLRPEDCFAPLRRGQPWAVIVRSSPATLDGDNDDMMDALAKKAPL